MTLGPHAILTAEAARSDRVADSQPPVACVQTQAQLTSQGTKEGYDRAADPEQGFSLLPSVVQQPSGGGGSW